ncbi:FecR family protein [Cyclobacterium marinum]|uniref:Anti-FecI sigma factor, FecR n=1 Tax=Cyclobacterium marinum (strain ATCC 25205 / DSM 745 / LMG 13164 / NCIMB 1802) TaxID=880070 RepID=G0J428_CYCMS|nr:FecR domain-containing protein [Cyclobacterium marinum]AEL26694.1 anti-FecI sigma factor, FecR [Cyclobacterium marinum DSM 745]
MKSGIHSVYDLLVDISFLDWVKSPTKETNRFWEEWQGDSPERKLMLLEAKAIANGIDFKKTSPENIRKELIFKRIQDSIHEDKEEPAPENIKIKSNLEKGVAKNSWLKWAAVFIGILVMSGIYFFVLNESMITHRTAYGETKSILLPDGSEVKLNGNSSLSYSNSWEIGEERDVWLEGEAYFTVKHLGGHEKFIVHATTDFNVEVLGTEFNVLNRKGKTKVVLSSGKVMLNLQKESSEERLQMAPGEMAEYLHHEKIITKKEVDPQVYTSWRNNRLLFEDTSLREIKTILESTYGLKVMVADSKLLEKRVYGSAPSNDVTLLLEGLERSLGNEISIEGKLVTIK